jgi:hypothetical protein
MNAPRCAVAWIPPLGIVLLVVLLAGCSQLGLPAFPPELRRPEGLRGEVFVVYDPYTVLGFGHTGLIVGASPSGRYFRYDQYASAEIAYGEHLREGRAGFLEGVTARLPSIFGLTREVIFRREGSSPAALLAPGEYLVPLAGLDPGAVRRAAQARYETAAGTLERASARRYVWLFNNCQHFVRDVLRQGGAIPERYFPKWFVSDALARLATASPP